MASAARAGLFALVLTGVPGAGQSNEDCLTCHSDATLSMKKGGASISLFTDAKLLEASVHAGSACVDCHVGFKPDESPHARPLKPVHCRDCHDIPGFDKSVHQRTPAAIAGRKHLRANCPDCHGTHNIRSPKDPKSSTHHASLSATCSRCHDTLALHFSASAHGEALKNGVLGAPSCADCHGEHRVEPVKSEDSPVYKTHEAKICLHCHLDNPEVRGRVGLSAGFIQSYEKSVHGLALAQGKVKAASCSDCHGAHDMYRRGNSKSRVDRMSVSATCAKCHSDVVNTYNGSIHGAELQRKNPDAPACTDCHGEHQILSPDDPRSKVAPKNLSAQVCAGCHNSVRLSQKYGMKGERFKTFADSYHGLASKGGSVEVANCASCHGVHDIRPSFDPKSTIHKSNLAATCGSCHPGANTNFTKGFVHVTADRAQSAVLYWIRVLYLALILCVIGGMLFHNGLDFLKRARHRLAVRQGRITEHTAPAVEYVRMTLNERIQHGLLFTSFFLLVITGFMLKFPDAWWVAPIRSLSEKIFDVRSLLHRIAASVMVAVSFYHVGYLLLTTRGRRLALDMLPGKKDLADALGLMLHNLGLSKTRPQFDRFSYIEKSEYWALIWGTGVMTVTGVIMWFDNFFIRIVTKLGWDIARTVHYYEAWLATLSILAWHFYFVIFNLDIYPIKLTWLTGKISEAEMLEEHPLELERLKAEQFGHLEGKK